MAIREYKCSSCKLLTEKLIPTSDLSPTTTKCPRCGQDAEFISISRTALLTSNFQERTLDVEIGHDAAQRWDDINNRQVKRDKIRQQTGQIGLSMVGRNDFAPLPEKDKILRTDVNEALTESGVKAGDTQIDQKIIGTD